MAEKKEEKAKKPRKRRSRKKEQPAEKPKEEPAKKEEKPEVKPAEAPKPAKPKRQRKKKKKSVKVEIARGKRKTSIARAVVREGEGRVRVNSMLVGSIPNRFARELIEEPVSIAGPQASKVDIEVNVSGGGEMGQAQASRTAIARALAQYFGEGLKKEYEELDKYFLKEDPRRVEPKKYRGPKARARFQKSYR
jgi:small subunit ribosomal protein S9